MEEKKRKEENRKKRKKRKRKDVMAKRYKVKEICFEYYIMK